ncbi:MAG: 50S ribosomal protein L10 [Ferruginibacter sp.]
MTKQEKNEVIELLKGKFSQYNNFYITDTESLTVAQVGKLRGHCFDKQVEMKVAKNTLIKKALESIDAEKYAGVYDSLHKVTALLFSENPKDPAMILSSFRKANNNEKPVLKAAFINGDVFVGDNQLKNLTQIKTKNELIGEIIGMLQSPIQRVLGALQNKDAAKAEEAAPVAPVTEPATEIPVVDPPPTEVPPLTPTTPPTETPTAETPTAETQAVESAPAVEAAPVEIPAEGEATPDTTA